MELMRRHGMEVAGKNAVVLGRSNIVGLPMALLLMKYVTPTPPPLLFSP
jgi:methylenetetrahydrofolate dehydrogenase (NADP+) / methenyltetrahydrofolate cyclohydrolase